MALKERMKDAELAQMQEALRAMEASQKAQADAIVNEREEARAAAQEPVRGTRNGNEESDPSRRRGQGSNRQSRN